MVTHWVLYLISAVCVVVGFWLLVRSVRRLERLNRNSGWPTVPGRITQSQVMEGKRPAFDVGYRYQVDDVFYDGDVVQVGVPTITNEELHQRFPVGAEVEVHYDPDRPSTSVLIPGPGKVFTLALVFSLVLLLFGFSFIATAIAHHAAESSDASSASSDLPPAMTGLNAPTCIVASGGQIYVCDNGYRPPSTESAPGLTVTPSPPRTTGRLLLKSNSRDLSLGRLNGPVGLAVDGGKVYVTDHDPAGSSGRLWMFTLTHPAYEPVMNVSGPPLLTFGTPGGLALDSGGNVYVAETSTGKVLKLEANAKAATEFFQAPDGGSVADVAIDGDNLYVTDPKNSRLYKISIRGGAAPTQVPADFLSHPQGLAIDHAGKIYVVDAGNHRVLKFERDLDSGVEVPFKGLDKPFDVAVDTDDRVYVTDQGKGVVAVANTQ